MKKIDKALQIAKMAAGGLASPKSLSQYPPYVTRMAARSFSGPIRGLTSGRGDKKQATVKAGSFVVPSHVLSALGKGNTEAGFRVMNSIFSGPGGFNAPLRGGKARMPSVSKTTTTPGLKFAYGGMADLPQTAAPESLGIMPADNRIGLEDDPFIGGITREQGYQERELQRQQEPMPDNHVPIQISDGEYVIPPEKVAEIGGGDIEVGHELLRRFSEKIKKSYIKDLKKIPRPK